MMQVSPLHESTCPLTGYNYLSAIVPLYTGLEGEVIQYLTGRIFDVKERDGWHQFCMANDKKVHGVSRLSDTSIFIGDGVEVILGSGVIDLSTNQEIKVSFTGPKTIHHGVDNRKGVLDLLVNNEG